MHYGANQLGVKAEIKDQFLQRIRLASGPRTALIGIVSRLATQKGFDLLFDCMPALLRAREFNLVVLGTGEPRYEQFFTGLQLRFPERVHFQHGYSDELAHWIEAASDMFLMPSRYEPCGLNQMYSMRYGTVPIVRRTGGLADSVQHFDRGHRRRHRHRVQRLQRARRHLGAQHGAGSIPEQGIVAPADAERHGAGLFLEPAGARLRRAVREHRAAADSQPYAAFLVERNVAYHAALQVHLPVDAIVHRVVAEAAGERAPARN